MIVSQSEPLTYTITAITQGADLEIDVIGVCLKALDQVDERARWRALAYLTDRYQWRPDSELHRPVGEQP